jgi:plastocyanin
MHLPRATRRTFRRVLAPIAASLVAPLSAAMLFTVAGCGDSTSVLPPAESVYAKLTLNYHAINLAVTGTGAEKTVQLQVAAMTGEGDALDIPAGAVTFHSDDPNVVSVDSNGVLTAVGEGYLIGVSAQFRVGDVTHADTAWVTVAQSPPSPAMVKFTMHPLDGDSARRALDITDAWLPTFGEDANGDPIEQWMVDNMAQWYTSSDYAIASPYPQYGWLTFYKPGTVTFTVTGYFYGRVLTDSLTYTVTEPLHGWVYVVTHDPDKADSAYFTPPSITIMRGGVISWTNKSKQPADVTFPDPSAATEAPDETGTGNIVALPSDSSNVASRTFAQPGTYTYTHGASGATGTIIVK